MYHVLFVLVKGTHRCFELTSSIVCFRLRRDMSDEQREQLTSILDDVYNTFVDTVAAARGKSRSEVESLLDEGIFDMQKLRDGGWVTDLK